MSGFLLDTNVLSCLAPDKPPISAPARDWFRVEANAGRLFLSAMTFLEIEQGLRSLARRGAVGRYQALLDWLEAVDDGYRERVLPLNATVARLAGVMSEAAKAKGVHPGLPDIIIAATARAHDLTLVTLNRKHFHPLGFIEDLPPALQSLRSRKRQSCRFALTRSHLFELFPRWVPCWRNKAVLSQGTSELTFAGTLDHVRPHPDQAPSSRWYCPCRCRRRAGGLQ